MSNKFLNKLKGLHMIPFGGCSIGMSLYAYLIDDNWILVDMGIGFLDGSSRSVLVPDPSILVEMKHKIKGIFITHMHEDHIGAIPYIWPLLNRTPIYGMPITCEMIKEKMNDFGISHVPLNRVELHKEIKLGNFNITYVPVAHSTPESCSLLVKTPYGNVLHTGDWRMDDDPVLGFSTSKEDFKKIGDNEDILAMFCDSTNAHTLNPMGTERAVRENLIELIKAQEGRGVVVTCFASNVARLETCYYAAKASGRQLAIMGRSLRRIEDVARKCGYFKNLPKFINEKQASKLDPKDVLMVCTGSQGEQNAALSKLAYSSRGTDFKIRRGDVVIFSSRAIPGNEKAIIALQGALISRGIEVINDEGSKIHASGHASMSELKEMYGLVKPNYLIPVHGELGNLHNHANFALECGIKNALVPHEGALIRLKKDDCEIENSLEIKTLLVDGIQLVPLNGDIKKERDLLESGVVVASLTVSKKDHKVKCDDISFVGIFEKTENEEKQQVIRDISASIAANCSKLKSADNKEIEKTAINIILAILADDRGLHPTVVVHIIEVK